MLTQCACHFCVDGPKLPDSPGCYGYRTGTSLQLDGWLYRARNSRHRCVEASRRRVDLCGLLPGRPFVWGRDGVNVYGALYRCTGTIPLKHAWAECPAWKWPYRFETSRPSTCICSIYNWHSRHKSRRRSFGAAGSSASFYPGNFRQLSSRCYVLRGVPHGDCLYVQSANPVSTGHCCTSGGQMRSTLHKRRQTMMSASSARRELRAAGKLCLSLALLGSTFVTSSVAQQSSAIPMQLTLEQAINLALKQNHSIHLRSLSVEQMQSKKDEARSNYLPQLKASGSVLHITEIEGVEIPAGAFGNYSSTGPVPAKSLLIDQGSDTGYIGGAGLEQPLTQLFRIHQAN